MGKTGRENRRYSTEFKLCVIMDMREHQYAHSFIEAQARASEAIANNFTLL